MSQIKDHPQFRGGGADEVRMCIRSLARQSKASSPARAVARVGGAVATVASLPKGVNRQLSPGTALSTDLEALFCCALLCSLSWLCMEHLALALVTSQPAADVINGLAL